MIHRGFVAVTRCVELQGPAGRSRKVNGSWHSMSLGFGVWSDYAWTLLVFTLWRRAGEPQLATSTRWWHRPDSDCRARPVQRRSTPPTLPLHLSVLDWLHA